MDRSFLSDASVIAASRRFTCVRLLTYESADEAKVLTSIFVGRSGNLENTTFALLACDGKTKLCRAGRSPDFAFQGGASEMAATMNDLAARAEKDEKKSAAEPLPLTATVRLAMNAAACDNLPLVVVCGDDATKRAALAERVATAAWSAPFLGRFAYAVEKSAEELKPIDGASGDAGVLVVEPDKFGATGKILARAAADADATKIAAALADALKKHRVEPKDARTQIAEARRLGIRWKTAIPETDPGPQGGGPPPGGRW